MDTIKGMQLTAQDIMKRGVRCVTLDMTMSDLERALIRDEVSGFPVVHEGKLVGIVSRSDVVRQLCVEQSVAEVVSDYYRDSTGFAPTRAQSLHRISEMVGESIEHKCVKDFMVHQLITVAPTQPVEEVASLLVRNHIHRVPVVEDGRLLGIITTLDLVRLIAEGRTQG